MGERCLTWWREGRPLVSRWAHTADGMDLTWVGRAANRYHSITRWVRWSWWSYVLGHRHQPLYDKASWWCTAWCRLRGHPAGQIFYSSGNEPDTRCADCGEEIA